MAFLHCGVSWIDMNGSSVLDNVAEHFAILEIILFFLLLGGDAETTKHIVIQRRSDTHLELLLLCPVLLLRRISVYRTDSE